MSGAGRYRERRRKQIEVPSGDVFTIRKPGRDSYMKLLDARDLRDKIPKMTEPNVDPDSGEVKELSAEKQAAVEEMMKVMDEVLIRCVVEPKLGETSGENVLAVDELDIVDYFVLVRGVFEFADMSEDKLSGLFRPGKKSTGPDGGEDSPSSEPEAKSDPPSGGPTG